MKHLSILLLLSLVGQSILAVETSTSSSSSLSAIVNQVQPDSAGWIKLSERLQSEYKDMQEKKDVESYTRVLNTLNEIEHYLGKINNINKQAAYDSLKPVLNINTVNARYITLSKSEQDVAFAIFKGEVAGFKDVVQYLKNELTPQGKFVNKINNCYNSAASNAQVGMNLMHHGASVGAAYIKDHKKATAGALAGAVAIGAAAYNREALRAFAKENAPKAWSFVKETGKNIGTKISKGYDLASKGYDWAYDTKPAIKSRIAIYETAPEMLAKLVEASKNNPRKAAIATAGTAGVVGSTIATVRAYNAYKANYNARKALARAENSPESTFDFSQALINENARKALAKAENSPEQGFDFSSLS